MEGGGGACVTFSILQAKYGKAPKYCIFKFIEGSFHSNQERKLNMAKSRDNGAETLNRCSQELGRYLSYRMLTMTNSFYKI